MTPFKKIGNVHLISPQLLLLLLHGCLNLCTSSKPRLRCRPGGIVLLGDVICWLGVGKLGLLLLMQLLQLISKKKRLFKMLKNYLAHTHAGRGFFSKDDCRSSMNNCGSIIKFSPHHGAGDTNKLSSIIPNIPFWSGFRKKKSFRTRHTRSN